MDPITTVLVLLFCVTVLALLAERIHVPYPTVMIVGGLVICFLPQLGNVVVDPKVIFTLFLPPLLYGAAWVTSWKDFRAHLKPITMLAIPLVLATTTGIALVAMWLIPGMTWPAAFALGAIISPPDAIAVSALTKRVRIPRQIVMILEGESLVNDATALIALRFAVAAAATGMFSVWHAAGDFVIVALGGVGIGLVLGWIVCEIHKRLDDSLIETTITFLTPYGAYLCAESIHVSGVLATVVAGLYVSWRSPALFGPRLRLQATAVWEFVQFVLNGLVFVLVGLQLPVILRELHQWTEFTILELIGMTILITVVAVLIRMAFVFSDAYAPRVLRWRGTDHCVRGGEVFLVGWTGMRGAVSLAAALSLPIAPYLPQRNIIIFITFGVILLTLVLQSMTLGTVIKWLGISPTANEFDEELTARLLVARAGHAFVNDIVASTDALGAYGPKLLAHYEERVRELEQGVGTLPPIMDGLELTPLQVHRAVLNEERRILLELRSSRQISYELFQRLMADVDAEEIRAEGMGRK